MLLVFIFTRYWGLRQGPGEVLEFILGKTMRTLLRYIGLLTFKQ